jgi:hypothetical protein
MEETRLAEIEERLGWRSVKWWHEFGEEGSEGHRLCYFERATEDLLEAYTALREINARGSHEFKTVLGTLWDRNGELQCCRFDLEVAKMRIEDLEAEVRRLRSLPPQQHGERGQDGGDAEDVAG